MTLRCLIADDEWLARERLRKWLIAEPDVEIIGECATGPETVEAVKKDAPHIVFLDIRLPGLDGFEVIQALGPNCSSVIVFVTAHNQFAIRAFEARATDYLLKPFDRDRFKTTLARARDVIRRGQRDQLGKEVLGMVTELQALSKVVQRFAIRSGRKITIVEPEEIQWIQCVDSYTELYVGKTVHLLRRTLTTLLAQLPPDRFVRISRSGIVNIHFIRELRLKSHGDYVVVLQNGVELSATRNYRSGLLKLMGQPE